MGVLTVASIDELKKAYTEIDNGNVETARKSLDEYKKSAHYILDALDRIKRAYF